MSAPAPVLERYREVVDDWSAFAGAMASPLPPCVWANPARLDADRLRALLAEDGVAAEPVAWSPGALRLPAGFRPGRHWGYEAGLFRVQEEASLLPVRLLAPRPGDRALDLCAAPGGKTAQIAMALGNRGTVVANDVRRERIAAVHDAIRRLGLLNVTTTCHDGARYPLAAGPFDRVLVDAPCSAEGTLRRNRFRAHRPGFRAWVQGRQRALLRRAAALVRPGGRIVYSTCTFAPEENEAVVDAVLAEQGGRLRVRAARIAGLEHSPGLDGWAGRRFSPALGHAIRLWPHRTGTTGGFFAVVLEREGAAPAASRPGGEASCAHERGLDRLWPLVEPFAMPPAAFDGLRLLAEGRYLRLVADDHAAPAIAGRVATGLPAGRVRAAVAKLATGAAMAFGGAARRRVLEIDRAAVAAYRARRPVAITGAGGGVPSGAVLVRHRGFALGLGVVRAGATGETVLESLSPKAWAGTGDVAV